MASEMMLTAPLRMPTASLIAMSNVLDRIERRAVRAARFIGDSFLSGIPVQDAGREPSRCGSPTAFAAARRGFHGPGNDLIFRPNSIGATVRSCQARRAYAVAVLRDIHGYAYVVAVLRDIHGYALTAPAVMPATILLLKKMKSTRGGREMSTTSAKSRFHCVTYMLMKLYSVSCTVAFFAPGKK